MNQIKHYLNLFKEALKEKERDYTTGSISDAVVLLAIPMILELSLESIFAIVDMFFVSRIGANAIATVGLTEAAATILYSLAIGLSTGATAIVARRVGEKNPRAAAEAGAQSILIALGISLLVSVIGLFFPDRLLGWMGASPEVIAEGAIFTQILIGGNAVIFLIFLINGLFRGAGNAAMAMKSLWIASAINIVMCPIAIHFWGLKGAAIATVIGRGTGVLYQCYHLFKGESTLRFQLSDFKPHWVNIKAILEISWPASLQFIIGSGSWIFLTRLVAEAGGTEASAGYQIAFRNFAFFILPAWGISNAAATLVGQNLGAKELDRAEKSVLQTMKLTSVIMGIVTGILVLFAGPIVQFYSTDSKVVAYGTEALRVLGTGFIFYGVSMILSQALNGAGDTKTPTRLNFLCFWVFQVPIAYYLTKYTSFNTLGSVLTVPLAHVLLTVLTWLYFKKGNWKKVQV